MIILPLLMGSIYHRCTQHPYHRGWIFVTKKRRKEIEAEATKRAKSAATTTNETMLRCFILEVPCFTVQQNSCFLHITSRANTGTFTMENFIWDYLPYKVYQQLLRAPRASDASIKDITSTIFTRWTKHENTHQFSSFAI